MDVWGGAAEYLVGRIGRQSVFDCFCVDLFDCCLVGGFVEYFIWFQDFVDFFIVL